MAKVKVKIPIDMVQKNSGSCNSRYRGRFLIYNMQESKVFKVVWHILQFDL